MKPSSSPHNTSPSQTSGKSRLLSLPPELRNIIYELVIDISFPNDTSASRVGQKDYLAAISLIHTCKQMRGESYKLLAGRLSAQLKTLDQILEACWMEVFRVGQCAFRQWNIIHIHQTAAQDALFLLELFC